MKCFVFGFFTSLQTSMFLPVFVSGSCPHDLVLLFSEESLSGK